MPRIIDKERAEILQSTDEFIIDSAINGTRKVSFDTLKESLGASGGGSAEGGTSVPTKLSELENDTNFVTEEQVNSRTEIDNAVIGDTSTWSSSKIANEMQWKFLGNLTTAGDLSDVVQTLLMKYALFAYRILQ